MEDQRSIIKDTDWDYLIGLDACRYDSFEMFNKIKGNYQRVESPAGDTIAWYNRVFFGKYDITLYSASPWLGKRVNIGGYLAGKHFKDVIEIWDKGWDNERQTTPPEITYEYAKDAEPKSIIWFEQPHFPAVSEKDKDLWCKSNPYKVESGRYLIDMYLKHEIPEERIRQAHFNSVEAVMPYVEKLVDRLKGKIIITADHGELLGELLEPNHTGWFHGEKEYAAFHPEKLYTVPLLIVE